MAARAAAKALDKSASSLHVSLVGVPRTVLPNDIRRLCGKSKVEHVSHVAINYRRFIPTETATLTFARPEYASAAVAALDKTVLGGKTVKAQLTKVQDESRKRGTDGLLEAGQRGIVTGNGPDGGISGGGKNVLLYGLPPRLTSNVVADSLRNFKVAGAEQGKPVVIKIENVSRNSTNRINTTSRFLLRLETVSEAYRLVRTLHLQKWRPDVNGDQFIARAHVVS